MDKRLAMESKRVMGEPHGGNVSVESGCKREWMHETRPQGSAPLPSSGVPIQHLAAGSNPASPTTTITEPVAAENNKQRGIV